MRLSSLHTAVAVICFAPQVVAAAHDLNGDWEIRSMGGDRAMRIQQKKAKIMVHREMWPEFEGERYKLEHLYRGKIKGTTIKGQLLVKEEEQTEYEILRKFTGRVVSDAKIEIDSYIVVRTDKPAAKGAPAATNAAAPVPKPPAPPPGPAAPPPPPAAPPAPPPPSEPPKPPPQNEPPPAKPDAPPTLFESIMATPGMKDLFNVAAREIPSKATRLTKEGDALYQAGKYRAALNKFTAANDVPGMGGTDLMHRIGQCHLKLGEHTEAQKVLRRALRLDPNNAAVRNDYDGAKAGR